MGCSVMAFLYSDMQFIVSLIFMMLLYHAWYVGLVVIVITMIAAIATVRCVYQLLTNTGMEFIITHKFCHQLSGLDVQAIYRVKSCATGILLG